MTTLVDSVLVYLAITIAIGLYATKFVAAHDPAFRIEGKPESRDVPDDPLSLTSGHIARRPR